MARPRPRLRLAFWNTWLLRPRLWPGGLVIPGGERLGLAPDVADRAPLVGQAIRGRWDLCGLSEVFESAEQQAVAAALPDAELLVGPDRRRLPRVTGSGLAVVADRRRFVLESADSMTYTTDGDLRDADRYAAKGAMFLRGTVGVDGPAIDIGVTHLFAGGDLLPIPGADDDARHHRVRMGQVDELVSFLADRWDRTNPLLVMGDFNVAAPDPGHPDIDVDGHHHDLTDRLAPLGLVDLWPTLGRGPGPTCSFTDPDDIDLDPDEPDRVVDPEPDHDPVGDRIDYLWLAQPQRGHRLVEADRPRRWACPRPGVHGGPAGSLSDHLAVATTLRFS